MSVLRIWLARKLCPEVFQNQERHRWSTLLLDDLWQWCGHEFPDVGAAALWVKRAVRQRYMSSEDFNRLVAEKRFDQTHVDSISEFREKLRRREFDGPKS